MPVRSDWRPTRQRFGMLAWRGLNARLTLDLTNNGPFLDQFVVQKSPRGREKKPYPRKASHLALFAAWEFAAQGKRTLIFSTQANWVEGYGKQVVDLCKRGYLAQLLDDEASIARALEVGKEWLGEDHPAVASLKAGVAIHHGRLPSPFLRELEVLLSEGVLKVIVASPTLSQGLNLNAAVLLVPALYRAGKPITGEEFANVAGRAGRAFVDVEGLIVHVMFDRVDWRSGEWRGLVASSKARTLKSGLIQIVGEILERLAREGVLARADAWEYLANAREAWRSPAEEATLAAQLAAAPDAEAETDDDEDEEAGGDEEESIEEEPLSELVERLDATVFGLVEALDADRADLPKLLDEALKGSLWARQIAREGEGREAQHRKVFEARANLIWSVTTPQARRGHFAMGVGLEAGLTIDAMARGAGRTHRSSRRRVSARRRRRTGGRPGGPRGATFGDATVHSRQEECAARQLESDLETVGVGCGGLGDRTAQYAHRGGGLHVPAGLGTGSHQDPASDFGLVAGHHSGWRSRISGDRGAAVHDVDVDPGGPPV